MRAVHRRLSGGGILGSGVLNDCGGNDLYHAEPEISPAAVLGGDLRYDLVPGHGPLESLDAQPDDYTADPFDFGPRVPPAPPED
jgi:hypothetical protein